MITRKPMYMHTGDAMILHISTNTFTLFYWSTVAVVAGTCTAGRGRLLANTAMNIIAFALNENLKNTHRSPAHTLMLLASHTFVTLIKTLLPNEMKQYVNEKVLEPNSSFDVQINTEEIKRTIALTLATA